MSTLTGKFFLTGSRFFDTATAESDTDWFCADSPENRAQLVGSGFVLVYETIRKDGNVTGLYKREGIDVQLLRDVATAVRIQVALKGAGFGPALKNKKLARALWAFGYALLGVQNGSSSNGEGPAGCGSPESFRGR